MGLAPRRWPRPDAASTPPALRRGRPDGRGPGRRFGVAAQTAHNWLVAAGVPRRVSHASRAEVSDVEVRRLYTVEGWTAAEVAAHWVCGTSTVYARLQRRGVPRRPARPRRSSRPADTELRRLYLERGLTLRQLAERFSVSPKAVRGWLDGVGVPRRGHGETSSANSADVVALYGRGWSGPHIATRSGCSTATVYPRLEAAGVARRGASCRRPPGADRGSRRRPVRPRHRGPALMSASRPSVGPSPARASRPCRRPSGARPPSTTPPCSRSPRGRGAPMAQPSSGSAGVFGPAATVQAATDPGPSFHGG